MSLSYTYVTEGGDLPAIAQKVREAQVVGLDLETTHLDPRLGRPRLLSLNPGKHAYVVDLWATGGLGPLREALDNPTRKPGAGRPVIVGQNLAFDQKWLWHHYGVELFPVFDTFRASVLIYNGKVGPDGKDLRHDLWSLYERELRIRPEVGDLGGSDWTATPLSKHQLDYAADDVLKLPALRLTLKEKLARLGLNTAAGIEFNVLLPEVAVELNGFNLDKPSWTALSAKYQKKAYELRDMLQAKLPSPTRQIGLFGYDPKFKITSPDQLLKSLRQVPGLGKLEGTAEEHLAPLAAQHPILKDALSYREAERFGTGFGEDYFKHVHPKTGRIHATYRGTLKAGRYAHTKPNLGAIPRGKEHRSCFKPPPGRCLVLADYTNIEMVAAAEIAQEDQLRQLFILGKDAHKYLGSEIAGVPESQLTKEQRQQAKPANFGFLYGMGWEKFILYAYLGYGVLFTPKEAQRIRNIFFTAYPRFKPWHQEMLEEARSKGMVRTPSGRLRWLKPDAYSEAFNTPVQGAGADGLKRALRAVFDQAKLHGPSKVYPEMPRVAMVHHVHDEIILEVDDEPGLVEESAKMLEREMVSAMATIIRTVPIRAEAAHGYSWADKA